MVDLDGKFRYSDIAVIRLSNEQKTILTYPNPSVSELKVTIPNEWQNKPVIYSMYNTNGVLVKQKQNSNAGQTEYAHRRPRLRSIYCKSQHRQSNSHSTNCKMN